MPHNILVTADSSSGGDSGGGGGGGGEPSLVFRGHNVTLRPAYMSREGRHCFVDMNVTLVRGTLKAFK